MPPQSSGMIVSSCIFVASIPTFWEIIKKKRSDKIFPNVYFANALNCLSSPGLNIVYTIINGIGLTLQLTFLSIALAYDKHKRFQEKILSISLMSLILIASMVILTLVYDTTTQKYLSPLTKMVAVIQTKSNHFLPFPMGLLVLINATMWLWYSIILFDILSLASHCVGVLSGAVQLILYLIYYTPVLPQPT